MHKLSFQALFKEKNLDKIAPDLTHVAKLAAK